MSSRKETGNESVFFIKLDLTDLVAIKAAAEQFVDKDSELRGLYNNAYVPRTLSVPKKTLHSNVTQRSHKHTRP